MSKYKKILLTLAFLSILPTMLLAKMNVLVSILPQKYFIEQIAKSKVNITTMVLPGDDPHEYEPSPKQMRSLSKARIYFGIGVRFEDIWLPKFLANNKNLILVKTQKDVKKIKIAKGIKSNNKNVYDPHIWTSTTNAAIMAKNIYQALSKYDKKNQSFYKKNYLDFLVKIKQTKAKIKDILKGTKKNKIVLVIHPAWGYFSKEFALNQVAIEKEGKAPRAQRLVSLVKLAKKNNIKYIFIQPEMSPKYAKIIAKQVGAKLISVSPLAFDWSKNLIYFAKSITLK